MAVLKIYQVQSKVRQPGDQAQGGLIPVSLATQLGKGLGEIGKVVDDIRVVFRIVAVFLCYIFYLTDSIIF